MLEQSHTSVISDAIKPQAVEISKKNNNAIECFLVMIRVVMSYTNVAVYSFNVWFKFIVQHISRFSC